MNDQQRQTEKEMRDLAFEHRNELSPDDGESMEPARLSQMVSLRLDSEVVTALRDLANERGKTVSDLLREGAGLILEREHSRTAIEFAYTVIVSQSRSVFDSAQAGRSGTDLRESSIAALITA